jgi:hypothetical protein
LGRDVYAYSIYLSLRTSHNLSSNASETYCTEYWEEEEMLLDKNSVKIFIKTENQDFEVDRSHKGAVFRFWD